MKALFILLITLLTSNAFAETCPNDIRLIFDDIKSSSSDLMYKYEHKIIPMKKIKGKKVCHYRNGDYEELSVKLFNYKRPYLDIRNHPRDEESEGFGLVVKLTPTDYLTSKVLNNAEFNHYGIYFDEDGCAFGQVSCGELQVSTGYTKFNRLQVRF